MAEHSDISTGLTLALGDWQAMDFSLLAALIPMLAASAFCSGSETALFGMSHSQRRELRDSGSMAARTIESLLKDQRMLLITLLLCNMTVNTLFFIISSVLMMRSGFGALGQTGFALGTLLAIVLLGEVLPKMLASSSPTSVARLIGPPLLAVHRLILPLRIVVNRFVVEPLSRLTTPRELPHPLTESELESLLEVSGVQGIIDEEEKRTLRDVFSIGRLRVRDVMTPRTRIVALPFDATREQVIAEARRSHRSRLPVYRQNLDDIMGLLNIKRYLQDTSPGATLVAHLTKPRYVPQMSTLEQLLQHFQQTRSKAAIVVDEYGGTAGIVAVEDVVEELVGDITGAREQPAGLPQLIGLNRWLADGEMPLHEWQEVFQPAVRDEFPQVSTLGGLIIHALGRGAEEGDTIRVGDMTLTVRVMDGERIVRVELLRMQDNDQGATEHAPETTNDPRQRGGSV